MPNAQNTRRVRAAHRAIRSHSPKWRREGALVTLVDVLADLMHWADARGESFSDALRTAQGHYRAEAYDYATKSEDE